MSTTTTPKSGLVKVTPGTVQNVDVVAQLNNNWDKLDGAAIVGAAGINPDFLRIQRAAATNGAFAAQVSGDTNDRCLIDASGKILWGPGNAAGDTNLYRSAASVLKTDDDFVSAGRISAARMPGMLIASMTPRTTPITLASTGVETILDTLTFTGVSGESYRVVWEVSCQSNSAGDFIGLRLRWASGGSVTTSGTLFRAVGPNADIANKGNVVHVEGVITPGVSGNVTVGGSMVRMAGTSGSLLTSHGAAGQQENVAFVFVA